MPQNRACLSILILHSRKRKIQMNVEVFSVESLPLNLQNASSCRALLHPRDLFLMSEALQYEFFFIIKLKIHNCVLDGIFCSFRKISVRTRSRCTKHSSPLFSTYTDQRPTIFYIESLSLHSYLTLRELIRTSVVEVQSEI